jgi:hypothetical protein
MSLNFSVNNLCNRPIPALFPVCSSALGLTEDLYGLTLALSRERREI